MCADLLFESTKKRQKVTKLSCFVNLFLLVVFVDASRVHTIFISIEIMDRNEFEGGFTIVKCSTKYSSKAALSNWFNQFEWETIARIITLQIVVTVRASTVKRRT